MFTGIVQCSGRIASRSTASGLTQLTVDPEGDLDAETRPPRPGDSICVCGVCLTAATVEARRLGFDVVPETLRSTKLGDLSEGDIVNLEPAVAPHQPLGGHFMQGHVDALGEVASLEKGDGESRLTVRVDEAVMAYLVRKGTIAIDGVSLTIAAMRADGFEVALIPTTLNLTSLGGLGEGDRVNLETDVIARTVVAWLNRRFDAAGEATKMESGRQGDQLTRQMLDEAGFSDMP